MRRILIIILTFAFAVSCASKIQQNIPAEVTMKKAMNYFERKKYAKAAEQFEETIRNASNPDLAGRAQLYLADSYFLDKEYALAVPAYETFLRIYPQSPEATGAQMRLGLCYYKQISTPDKDMKDAEEALRIFSDIQKNDADFAAEHDLTAKIKELRNLLAEREMIVSDFYFRTDQERAAVGRLQYIIEYYSDTAVYPEGLIKLGDYYADKEGYDSEAIKYYRAVIRAFPNSKYAEKVNGRLSKILARITNNPKHMEN